jgi:hypothetical protein
MQDVRTDPPHVPIRRSAWPTRRTPRWLFAAGGVLLAIAVLVGIAHRPTAGERATDLKGLITTLRTDVQSCSGGVGESLYVLRAIETGISHQMATAQSIANTAAANCTTLNNMGLDDLTSVQVDESLDGYHLQAAVKDLIAWSLADAPRVCSDVLRVLSDRGKPSEPAARAALKQAQRKLDAQRAVVYAAFAPAIKALAPHARLFVLQG